jgi:hypothetical protein
MPIMPIMPMMEIPTMMLAAPYEDPSSTSAVDGLFPCSCISNAR